MENTCPRFREFSSPELVPLAPSSSVMPEDYGLEGIASNVKLLLKLIQDHQASPKDNNGRGTHRIAGMMTILNDVKNRIEKSQSSKKRIAELRRCNTDLRPHCAPRDKKPTEAIMDDKEKLRKQLNASLAARKSLEIMCSSLGKEKEIMASELAKKVHELNEMEEFANDLKAQNKTLLAKLQALATEHKEKKGSSIGEAQGNAALQERNKALSEQLLKSLDSYRCLKRKYKVAKEENIEICTTMEEIGTEVTAGLERIRSLRQRMDTNNDQPVDIGEQISALEQIFECFDMKISKHEERNSECAKPKAETNAAKPSVLA